MPAELNDDVEVDPKYAAFAENTVDDARVDLKRVPSNVSVVPLVIRVPSK